MNRPSYSDRVDTGVEWLENIPSHWQCATLSRFTVARCDGPFGSSLRSEHYVDAGVRVIRLQNIGVAEFRDQDKAFIDTDYFNQKLTRHAVEAGDLLVAGLGDQSHPVGRACAAPADISPAMVKADCFRFRLRTEVLRSHFAAYQLSALAAVSAGALATGATRSRTNLSVTSARKLAIPPLEEQDAIATFLDRETAKIDALIDRKQRLIELLQEKRTALITQAVTQGLDPEVEMKDSGVEWLGEIPLDWHLSRLKFLSSFVTSGSRGWAQYYSDDGPTFIRIGNLRSASIDLDLASRQAVRPPRGSETRRARTSSGDLLVSITALIGGVGVVPEDLGEAYVNQHIALVRPRKHAPSSRWLAFCLLSKIGKTQFKRELYGGTKDGLSLDDVREAVVVLPSAEEQDRIVRFLDTHLAALDALISQVNKAKQMLTEYRTALISAAVTGKIDVREAA